MINRSKMRQRIEAIRFVANLLNAIANSQETKLRRR